MWHTCAHIGYISSHCTYKQWHRHAHTHGAAIRLDILCYLFTHAAHVRTYSTVTCSTQCDHCSIIHAYIHLFMPHIKKKKMFTAQLKGQVRMVEMILWYITGCRCSSAWDCDKSVLVWLNVAISMQICSVCKFKCCSNLHSAPLQCHRWIVKVLLNPKPLSVK